ncbi:hypothetical protein LguiA_007542 [Lonicera macranthoides]
MASSSSSSSGFSKSLKTTTLTCHCGYPAPIRVSWTKENPGRRFAGCRNYRARPCNFFKWIDDDDLKTYKEILYELHCKYKDLQRKHDDLNNMVETVKNFSAEAEKNNYEQMDNYKEMVKEKKFVAAKENGMNIGAEDCLLPVDVMK